MECAHTANKDNYRPGIQGFSIYKEECTKCYGTVSDTLYLCLRCFTGSCKDHSLQHFHNAKHPLALRIQKILISEPTSAPQKITKIAIGKEGGIDFVPDHYQTITKLFCFACNSEIGSNKEIETLSNALLSAHSASEESSLKEWELQLKDCIHAKELIQEDIHKLPDKEHIHCEKCELSSNLWLCLTCGVLGCGRKSPGEITSGNGHALEHYTATKHSVVCKLGTIGKEGIPSIHCYACDDEVADKDIGKHLLSLGIDAKSQSKTEKTIGELELALNLAFDLSKTYELTKNMELRFGKGYTGIKNTGNTCYIASVLQLLYSIEPIQIRYLDELKDHHTKCSRLPADCFFCQIIKLFNGMSSGKCSEKMLQKKVEFEGQTLEDKKIDVYYQEGVNVGMLKNVVGKGHPYFSTSKQQDAYEYFVHFLNFMQKAEMTIKGKDHSTLFQFNAQTKLMCTVCHGVKYMTSKEQTLSLPIPLNDLSDVSSKIKVPFKDCLEALCQKESVSLFCPVCKKNSTFYKDN